MSNSSVPHPFCVLCKKGGKPQTFEVRAFPLLRQKSETQVLRLRYASLRMTASVEHGRWLATPKSLVHQETAQ